MWGIFVYWHKESFQLFWQSSVLFLYSVLYALYIQSTPFTLLIYLFTCYFHLCTLRSPLSFSTWYCWKLNVGSLWNWGNTAQSMYPISISFNEIISNYSSGNLSFIIINDHIWESVYVIWAGCWLISTKCKNHTKIIFQLVFNNRLRNKSI